MSPVNDLMHHVATFRRKGYLDRVTLVCPDPEFVCAVRTCRFCLEGEPLLGVVADDPFERLHVAAFKFWSLHLHMHIVV